MRLWKVLCVLCVLVLGACSKNDTANKDFENTYNSFVQSILDNNGAETKDLPFSHRLEVVQNNEGMYHYKIIVDNPKIAMYSIQMLVVDKSMDGSQTMFPCIGIHPDEDLYSMIPFQENVDKKFMKGVILEGVTPSSKFTLNVEASWKDYAKVKTSTAFFNYTYDYEKDHVENTEGSKE